MKKKIVIKHHLSEEVYVATCPALPGCISQGKTRSEAVKNIKDAVVGYVKSLKKHNEVV